MVARYQIDRQHQNLTCYRRHSIANPTQSPRFYVKVLRATHNRSINAEPGFQPVSVDRGWKSTLNLSYGLALLLGWGKLPGAVMKVILWIVSDHEEGVRCSSWIIGHTATSAVEDSNKKSDWFIYVVTEGDPWNLAGFRSACAKTGLTAFCCTVPVVCDRISSHVPYPRLTPSQAGDGLLCSAV
nr:hypothetical protein CFP56_13189 [Quercus suber]